jgi:cell division protein FtsB
MSFKKRKPRPKQTLSSVQESRMLKIIIALVVIALLWIIFVPRSGVLTIINKRSALQKLQRETTQIKKQTGELEKEIDRLYNDPAYLEEVARKDFGLLKKNEKVYDFSKPKTNEKH